MYPPSPQGTAPASSGLGFGHPQHGAPTGSPALSVSRVTGGASSSTGTPIGSPALSVSRATGGAGSDVSSGMYGIPERSSGVDGGAASSARSMSGRRGSRVLAVAETAFSPTASSPVAQDAGSAAAGHVSTSLADAEELQRQLLRQLSGSPESAFRGFGSAGGGSSSGAGCGDGGTANTAGLGRLVDSWGLPGDGDAFAALPSNKGGAPPPVARATPRHVAARSRSGTPSEDPRAGTPPVRGAASRQPSDGRQQRQAPATARVAPKGGNAASDWQRRSSPVVQRHSTPVPGAASARQTPQRQSPQRQSPQRQQQQQQQARRVSLGRNSAPAPSPGRQSRKGPEWAPPSWAASAPVPGMELPEKDKEEEGGAGIPSGASAPETTGGSRRRTSLAPAVSPPPAAQPGDVGRWGQLASCRREAAITERRLRAELSEARRDLEEVESKTSVRLKALRGTAERSEASLREATAELHASQSAGPGASKLLRHRSESPARRNTIRCSERVGGSSGWLTGRGSGMRGGGVTSGHGAAAETGIHRTPSSADAKGEKSGSGVGLGDQAAGGVLDERDAVGASSDELPGLSEMSAAELRHLCDCEEFELSLARSSEESFAEEAAAAEELQEHLAQAAERRGIESRSLSLEVARVERLLADCCSSSGSVHIQIGDLVQEDARRHRMEECTVMAAMLAERREHVTAVRAELPRLATMLRMEEEAAAASECRKPASEAAEAAVEAATGALVRSRTGSARLAAELKALGNEERRSPLRSPRHTPRKEPHSEQRELRLAAHSWSPASSSSSAPTVAHAPAASPPALPADMQSVGSTAEAAALAAIELAARSAGEEEVPVAQLALIAAEHEAQATAMAAALRAARADRGVAHEAYMEAEARAEAAAVSLSRQRWTNSLEWLHGKRNHVAAKLQETIYRASVCEAVSLDVARVVRSARSDSPLQAGSLKNSTTASVPCSTVASPVMGQQSVLSASVGSPGGDTMVSPRHRVLLRGWRRMSERCSEEHASLKSEVLAQASLEVEVQQQRQQYHDACVTNALLQSHLQSIGESLGSRAEALEELQRKRPAEISPSSPFQEQLLGAVAPMPPPPSFEFLQHRPGESRDVQSQQLLRQQQQLQQQHMLLELREHHMAEMSEAVALETASTADEETKKSHEEKLILEIKWQQVLAKQQIEEDKHILQKALDDGMLQRRFMEQQLRREIQRLSDADSPLVPAGAHGAAGASRQTSEPVAASGFGGEVAACAIDERVIAHMATVVEETQAFLQEQLRSFDDLEREHAELGRRLADALTHADGPEAAKAEMARTQSTVDIDLLRRESLAHAERCEAYRERLWELSGSSQAASVGTCIMRPLSRPLDAVEEDPSSVPSTSRRRPLQLGPVILPWHPPPAIAEEPASPASPLE